MKNPHTNFFLWAFSLILLSITMGACEEKKVFSYMENDLKMIDVLIDVHTVDAALREYKDTKVKDSLRRTYFDQIYQIHQVDEKWIRNQRARLELDPVRMDSVYSRALSIVEVLKAKGRDK